MPPTTQLRLAPSDDDHLSSNSGFTGVKGFESTRHMIIIVGDESDVHGVARHAKREVGFIHTRKHYVCASLVQNAV